MNNGCGITEKRNPAINRQRIKRIVRRPKGVLRLVVPNGADPALPKIELDGRINHHHIVDPWLKGAESLNIQPDKRSSQHGKERSDKYLLGNQMEPLTGT